MTVNSTAIWRVRPSGSNTNGGGYDPGISGAATDYSQQNAAQATGSHGTATGTTTFTDTVAANFTAAMVGNALWIASGAGFTVGAYFVVTFNSSTSVVLDRSPGTGTVAVWNLGGGWVDFWTNVGLSNTTPVPGNTIFILGSGTPNPSSYSFDYSVPSVGAIGPCVGNATAGFVTFANDPSTPGYLAPPNTNGGMPLIRSSATTFATMWNTASNYNKLEGLWIVSAITGGAIICFESAPFSLFGCVVDMAAFGGTLYDTNSSVDLIGCEIFSSTGGGAVAAPAIYIGVSNASAYSEVIGCNIHDCTTAGVQFYGGAMRHCIIAKNAGDAIALEASSAAFGVFLDNNTIDGNTGHGINIATQIQLSTSRLFNNIISNQTGAGKFGLTVGAGTATANNAVAAFVDYNVYYNNTANYNAISAGPHDTVLGTPPYVASSTENYSLV